MSEISREEAIKCIQNEHCKYCNHYEDEDCDYCYLGKAISDMQKLEKIETLICKDDCTKCETDLCSEYQIRQILKGDKKNE